MSSRIYSHEAIIDAFAGAVNGYRYAAELAALIAPRDRDLPFAAGARNGGCMDFVQA